MRCAQCGEEPHACRFDATCDLRPAEGFRAPCLLKELRSKQVEAEERILHPVKIVKKPNPKRTRKERPQHVPEGERASAR